MIELTPLDVRKKRGDFRQKLRGYDPEEVDTFLELVEDRMEVLVKDNLALREKVRLLEKRLETLEGREEAVQDALVSAQALRREVQEQAARDVEKLESQVRREVDLLRREAESELEARFNEARDLMKERQRALEELERNRRKFLKSFRSLLERELDAVEVEESRKPLEDAPLDLEFRGWKRKEPEELQLSAVEEVVGGPEEESLEEEGEEQALLEDGLDPEAEEPAPPAETALPEGGLPEEDPMGSEEEAVSSEEDVLSEADTPSRKGDLSYEYDLSRDEAPPVEDALFGEETSGTEAGGEEEDGTDEPLWLSALLERQEAEEAMSDEDGTLEGPDPEDSDEERRT